MDKKEKIEKIVIGCLGIAVVTGALHSLYSNPAREPLPADFTVTENFSGDIHLNIDWTEVDNEEYNTPTIRVNRTLQKVSDESTSFSKELSDELRLVALRIESEPYKKKNPTLRTTANVNIKPVFNAYQKIVSFEHIDDELSFTHILKHEYVKKINTETLEFHLYSQDGLLIESVKPKEVEIKDGMLTQKVQLLNAPISDEDLIFIVISYDIDNISYTQFVRDFDNEPLNQTGAYKYEPIFINGIFALKKNNQSSVKLTDYAIHGESLHLEVDGLSSLNSYQLLPASPNAEPLDTKTYSSKANKGIELDKIPVGSYLIKLNDNLLHTNQSDTSFFTWYTITRNQSNHLIELKSYSGLVILSVTHVDTLPAEVYDIVVDAGHGGSDAGAAYAGMLEKEEALKVSKYMAEKFEAYGLKVKLTRTGDEIEAEKNISDYETKPFVSKGRVDMVYNTQAKLVVSNHLNAFNGRGQGSEIYSSIFTNNDWASSIASEFEKIGRELNNADNGFRVSNGSYKKSINCLSLDSLVCKSSLSDYLYMIRETGGSFTQPATLIIKNSNYTEAPKYGAESILMEYIYLDNANERSYWENNWKLLADAFVEATLNYLEIKH